MIVATCSLWFGHKQEEHTTHCAFWSSERCAQILSEDWQSRAGWEASYCQTFYSNTYFSIHRLSQPSGAMSINMAADHSKHVESIMKAFLATSQCRRKELLGNSDESENLKTCLTSAEYG